MNRKTRSLNANNANLVEAARRAALVVLLGAIAACSKSGGDASLDVVVKDVSMAIVASASVTTTAATEPVQTGADGHARFSGLAAGAYTVTAESATAGSGTAQISLRAGEARQLTLILHKTGTGGGSDGGVDAAGDGSPDGRSDGSSTGPDGGDAGSPPPPIVLQDLTKDSNGINLRWTSTVTFPSYRIYRSKDPDGGFSIIDILNDPAAATYRDETVTLGGGYRYRVAGLPGDGSEITSNVQAISAGLYVAVNSQVERMRADPKRPYLYAIDKVNNSLHFIDLAGMTVEKTIFIGSAPTGLDISLDGTELYVANSGSTEIAVVDLTMRAKSRSLLVEPTSSSPGYPYRLVATTGNTLVFTASDGYYLRLVNAASGATLTTVSSSSGGSLIASPDGTHVYTGGYYLYRFDIVGATMKQVDSNSDFNSSTATIARSGDGMYLFWGAKKVLATNLKSTLGTFAETIQLGNSTGSLAVGTTRTYDGDTFIAKATLPLSSTVVALSPDDKTLYLYDQNTSRIYFWKTP